MSDTAAVRVSRTTRIGMGVYVAIVLVLLFAPLAVMVLFALQPAPRMSFPLSGLSFRWFDELLHDGQVGESLRRSLLVGFGTALGSGLLGMQAALALVKMGRRTRSVISTVALLPLAFPALLYAIGLAVFFHEVGVGFSLWATLAAHIVLTLPFSFLIIGAALERFRFSLLEAARDLGASGPRAFVTITLPSILPAVLGAMLLAMAISIDEFVIAFFTAGPGNQTLPMLLYGRLNLGVTPSLNAVGTLLLLMTTGLALLSARATTRNAA
jgi:spermidine/putrescine transport system permease protein